MLPHDHIFQQTAAISAITMKYMLYESGLGSGLAHGNSPAGIYN